MHFWIRAETRPDEARLPLTPEAVGILGAKGHRITVEASAQAAIPLDDYIDQGAHPAEQGSWPTAPEDVYVLGLKELPDTGLPLSHKHIMFGHAYKRQPQAKTFLNRFKAGGGTLLDLEYLTDVAGNRRVAFGQWAGFAGTVVTVRAWAAGQSGKPCPPVVMQRTSTAMLDQVRAELGSAQPRVLVIGAKGRVGSGALRAAEELNLPITRWDMAETAHGGPYPEIRHHDIMLNCILAGPKSPVFLSVSDLSLPRQLTTIGDIACDPGSPFSPLPIYDASTTWEKPTTLVHDSPTLEVMAIDNLPSLLPREASQDFSAQLLPILLEMTDDPNGTWAKAKDHFHIACSD
jgi:saccharopine dehydrogenase (NAD+, L-lysine-forming)